MSKAEFQDTTLPYWSIEQAAKHFGFSRRAMRRYIADGLPTYFAGTMVKPEEIIAEQLKRRSSERATRAQ